MTTETSAWKKLGKSFSQDDDTSVFWDYRSKTIEIFTNRRSIYEKCLERNGKPIRKVCDDEARVYRLFYPFDQARTADTIVKILKEATEARV